MLMTLLVGKIFGSKLSYCFTYSCTKRIQDPLVKTDGGSDYIIINTLGIFNPENIFN